MAIRDFMGLNVSEFKKYIKAAKKNNTKKCCLWSEQGENSYFCDGYMIVRFAGVSLARIASSFGLAYDDLPNEEKPAQDQEKIFNSFNPLEYNPAQVSKWSYEGKRNGTVGYCRLIVNNSSYCLMDENKIAPFQGLAVYMKNELGGVMFRWGFDDVMTAFVLPVRPGKDLLPVYKAIQEHTMKEVEELKNA